MLAQLHKPRYVGHTKTSAAGSAPSPLLETKRNREANPRITFRCIGLWCNRACGDIRRARLQAIGFAALTKAHVTKQLQRRRQLPAQTATNFSEGLLRGPGVANFSILGANASEQIRGYCIARVGFVNRCAFNAAVNAGAFTHARAAKFAFEQEVRRQPNPGQQANIVALGIVFGGDTAGKYTDGKTRQLRRRRHVLICTLHTWAGCHRIIRRHDRCGVGWIDVAAWIIAILIDATADNDGA